MKESLTVGKVRLPDVTIRKRASERADLLFKIVISRRLMPPIKRLKTIISGVGLTLEELKSCQHPALQSSVVSNDFGMKSMRKHSISAEVCFHTLT